MKKSTAAVMMVGILNAGYAQAGVTGIYNSPTVDTLSQIALLPGGKFCFAFMGGSWDMLLAGNYQIQGSQITFKEKRVNTDGFVAFENNDAESKTRAAVINGRSLSDASDAIFGTSADGSVPREMRLILEAGYNGFKETYTLPIAQDDTVFIGIPSHPDESDASELEYTLYAFKPKASSMVLNLFFDRNATRDSFDASGTLKGNQILLGSEPFTKQGTTINPKTLSQIQDNCIQPVFSPATVRQENRLLPIKTFKIKRHKPSEFHFKMDEQYRNTGRNIIQG